MGRRDPRKSVDVPIALAMPQFEPTARRGFFTPVIDLYLMLRGAIK
jgi:hypothetical protein